MSFECLEFDFMRLRIGEMISLAMLMGLCFREALAGFNQSVNVVVLFRRLESLCSPTEKVSNIHEQYCEGHNGTRMGSRV